MQKNERIKKIAVHYHTEDTPFWERTIPTEMITPECLYFIRDYWDDFGYQTSFNVYYINSKMEERKLGQVKFLAKNTDGQIEDIVEKNTIKQILKGEINNFCSMGQDFSYYETLHQLFPKDYKEMLKELHDIAYYREYASQFKSSRAYQISLLRTRNARKVCSEIRARIHNKYKTEKTKQIIFNVSRNQNITQLKFEFNTATILPGRIVAVIGENGIGKSSILASLAKALCSEENTTTGNINGSLDEMSSTFSEVIGISYNPYDYNFIFGQQEEKSKDIELPHNYTYCGIMNTRCDIQPEDQFNASYHNSIRMIEQKGRMDDLKTAIYKLLPNKLWDPTKDLTKLSTGERYLVRAITDMIASIEDESIILYDEPELHLHPTMISHMLSALNELLNNLNSYMIIATHSPQILQDIPSKYVLILDELTNEPDSSGNWLSSLFEGTNTLRCRKPRIECFGNSISTITAEVFDTSQDTYRNIFKRLVQDGYSVHDVQKLFSQPLSLNANLALESAYTLYGRKGVEGEKA